MESNRFRIALLQKTALPGHFDTNLNALLKPCKPPRKTAPICSCRRSASLPDITSPSPTGTGSPKTVPCYKLSAKRLDNSKSEWWQLVFLKEKSSPETPLGYWTNRDGF